MNSKQRPVMVASRRLAALGAILATVAVVVILIDALIRSGVNLVLGVVGLVVAVQGAWWAVSTRGVRRALGAGVLAVLLCNPWSGGGKVGRFGIVERASELGVETVMLHHGLDLETLARDAVARGADCLGMAGGDGSQALVASIAVEHGLPFVCVSAGTRNHFALDLGLSIDDPRRSLAAFRDAYERRVDFATVNGRLFVNNVSLGVYAKIVHDPTYRDAKVAAAATA